MNESSCPRCKEPNSLVFGQDVCYNGNKQCYYLEKSIHPSNVACKSCYAYYCSVCQTNFTNGDLTCVVETFVTTVSKNKTKAIKNLNEVIIQFVSTVKNNSRSIAQET